MDNNERWMWTCLILSVTMLIVGTFFGYSVATMKWKVLCIEKGCAEINQVSGQFEWTMKENEK